LIDQDDTQYNCFFKHSPRKPIEERDLKCHRDGLLKSISSFCKSCNNRCARTFRVPQLRASSGYAYDHSCYKIVDQKD